MNRDLKPKRLRNTALDDQWKIPLQYEDIGPKENQKGMFNYLCSTFSSKLFLQHFYAIVSIILEILDHCFSTTVTCPVTQIWTDFLNTEIFKANTCSQKIKIIDKSRVKIHWFF